MRQTMKKILILLVLAVLGISASYAQKGMSQIGIQLVGKKNVSGMYLDDHYSYDYFYHSDKKWLYGGKIVYMYNVSDHYRIAPYVEALLGYDKPNVQVGIDNHLFFMNVRKTRPYFIAGIAYGVIPAYCDELDNTITRDAGIVQGGFGLDSRISHNLSLQVELKAVGAVIGDITGVGISASVGLTYNF